MSVQSGNPSQQLSQPSEQPQQNELKLWTHPEFAYLVDTIIRPLQKPTYFLAGTEDLRIVLPQLSLKNPDDDVLILIRPYVHSMAIYCRVLPNKRILCYIGDSQAFHWRYYPTRNIIQLFVERFSNNIDIILPNTPLQNPDFQFGCSVISIETLGYLAVHAEQFVTELSQCAFQSFPETVANNIPAQVRLLAEGVMPRHFIETIKTKFNCGDSIESTEITTELSHQSLTSLIPESNIIARARTFSLPDDLALTPIKFQQWQYFSTQPHRLNVDDNYLYAENMGITVNAQAQVELRFYFKDATHFLFNNCFLCSTEQYPVDVREEELIGFIPDLKFDRETLTITIYADSFGELRKKLAVLESSQSLMTFYQNGLFQCVPILRFIAEAKELIDKRLIESDTLTGGLALDQVNSALRKLFIARPSVFVLSEHYTLTDQHIIQNIIANVPLHYQYVVFAFGLLDTISGDYHQVGVVIDQKNKKVTILDSAGNHNFSEIISSFSSLTDYQFVVGNAINIMTNSWSCGVDTILNILHFFEMLEQHFNVNDLNGCLSKIIRLASDQGDNRYIVSQKHESQQLIAKVIIDYINSLENANDFDTIRNILTQYREKTSSLIFLHDLLAQAKMMTDTAYGGAIRKRRQIAVLQLIIGLSDLYNFTASSQGEHYLITKLIPNIFNNLPSESEFTRARKQIIVYSTIEYEMLGYLGEQIRFMLNEGEHNHYLLLKLLDTLTKTSDWYVFLNDNTHENHAAKLTHEIFSLDMFYTEYSKHVSQEFIVFCIIEKIADILVSLQLQAHTKQAAVAAERRNMQCYEDATTQYFYQQFVRELTEESTTPIDLNSKSEIIKILSDRGRKLIFKFSAKRWKIELLIYFEMNPIWFTTSLFERWLSALSEKPDFRAEPLWYQLFVILTESDKQSNTHYAGDLLTGKFELIKSEMDIGKELFKKFDVKRLLTELLLYFEVNRDWLNKTLFEHWLAMLKDRPSFNSYPLWFQLYIALKESDQQLSTQNADAFLAQNLVNISKNLPVTSDLCILLSWIIPSQITIQLKLLLIKDLIDKARYRFETIVCESNRRQNHATTVCLDILLRISKLDAQQFSQFLNENSTFLITESLLNITQRTLKNYVLTDRDYQLDAALLQYPQLFLASFNKSRWLFSSLLLAELCLFFKLTLKRVIPESEFDSCVEALSILYSKIDSEDDLLQALAVMPQVLRYHFVKKARFAFMSYEVAARVMPQLSEEHRLDYFYDTRHMIASTTEAQRILNCLPIGKRAELAQGFFVFAKSMAELCGLLDYLPNENHSQIIQRCKHFVKTRHDLILFYKYSDSDTRMQLTLQLVGKVSDAEQANKFMLTVFIIWFEMTKDRNYKEACHFLSSIMQLIPVHIIKELKKIVKTGLKEFLRDLWHSYAGVSDMKINEFLTNWLNEDSISTALKHNKDPNNYFGIYVAVLFTVLQQQWQMNDKEDISSQAIQFGLFSQRDMVVMRTGYRGLETRTSNDEQFLRAFCNEPDDKCVLDISKMLFEILSAVSQFQGITQYDENSVNSLKRKPSSSLFFDKNILNSALNNHNDVSLIKMFLKQVDKKSIMDILLKQDPQIFYNKIAKKNEDIIEALLSRKTGVR